MEQKRYYYSRSNVYGWCVYDRQTHQPAYEACMYLLPPVKEDRNGNVYESPILLESEYKAIRLCARLNIADKKSKGD